MFRKSPLLLLPLSLGFSACASPEPTYRPAISLSENDQDLSWTSLAENDVLRVTVYGHPEASTEGTGARIDGEGVITLPLLGPVQLSGLSVEDARGYLESLLSEFIRDPKVALAVLEYGQRDFYVIGQLEKPGPYLLDRPLTALQAISYGGQVLPGANRKDVYLLRRQGEKFQVHAFSLTEPGPDGLANVLPGDILFVGRSSAGRFTEEVLPYLQGLGFISAVPVGLDAVFH